jgi:hypothetical protein
MSLVASTLNSQQAQNDPLTAAGLTPPVAPPPTPLPELPTFPSLRDLQITPTQPTNGLAGGSLGLGQGPQGGTQQSALTPADQQAAAQPAQPVSTPNSITINLAQPPQMTAPQSTAGLTASEQQLRDQRITAAGEVVGARQQADQKALQQQAAGQGVDPATQRALLMNQQLGQQQDYRKMVLDLDNEAWGRAVARQDATLRAATEGFLSMLETATSPEQMDAIMRMGAEYGVPQEMLNAIARNPEAWQRVMDSNRAVADAARREQQAIWVNALPEVMDDAAVAGKFNDYLNNVWTDVGRLKDLAEVANLTEEDFAAFEEATGNVVDRESAEGKALAFAWKEYGDAVRTIRAANEANDVIGELETKGVVLSETDAPRVAAMFKALDDAGDAKLTKLLELDQGFDPENGAASIFFEDWQGNPITDMAAHNADPLQSKLDKAYFDYATGGGPLSRSDWYAAVESRPAGIVNATAEDLAAYADSAGAYLATGKLGELATRMNDVDWWATVSKAAPEAYYKPDGARWRYGRELRSKLEYNGWGPGKGFTDGDGTRWIITGPVSVQYYDRSGPNNEWLAYVDAVDQNGNTQRVRIGSFAAT